MSLDPRTARQARKQAKREAKARLKARRAAVKAKLAEARAAQKAARAARPDVQRAERRKRVRRRLTLLALLLLLLLLRRCECDAPGEGPPPPDAAVDAAIAPDMGPDAAKPTAKKKAPRKKPIRSRIERRERPEFRNPTPPPADWLVALRIQVAARGPRMARCFEGTDRPGALEWRAVVDVERGVVSDHAFEPVLDGAQLSKKLERCLIAVLADPPYSLPPSEEIGRPRVSIIVEF